MKSKLLLLTPVFILASQFSITTSHAAVIIGLGSQFIGESWQPQGIAWRNPLVAKTNDIDGDNIIGTAGYYLAKTTFGPGNNESYINPNFDTTQMTFSSVSWLGVSASSTLVNNQTNYNFRQFQDPNNTATKLSVGYMGRRFSSVLTIGNYYSLYDFTVGAGIPGDFAITVAMHPEIGAGNIPSALRLTQTAGSGSSTVTLTSGGGYTDFNAEFVTFRINNALPGDQFQLLGQAANANNLLINGLMFDVVPIPEPSQVTLLILGILITGTFFLRKKSARFAHK